jgi:hypothetical protein
MKVLSKEQLEKLTTKRLLAYKNKFLAVPDVCAERCLCDKEVVMSKVHRQWSRTYSEIKAVLATREHVE